MPDRWDDRIGSLRHSAPQHRGPYPLAASGTEGSIEAEVKPVDQHIEEYADHKCYYVNTTTPIPRRQGAEQPALHGARRQPTIDTKIRFGPIVMRVASVLPIQNHIRPQRPRLH
jgi:hypothetical protein